MRKSRYRPEHMRMLNDRRWAETKAIVDARAKGLCEWCVRDGREYGLKTGNESLARTGWIRQGIDHHHLIPFESARTTQEAERLCYDPNNVVLLCVEHHRAEHNQKGYHKKENVKARRDQAFERWKERQQRGQSCACISSAEREAPRTECKERQTKRNNDGTERNQEIMCVPSPSDGQGGAARPDDTPTD